MNQKKGMRLEIKEITEQGTFEGLLSPYGNVDNGGDVVMAGAYTKTLKEQGNTRPMLWQHKSDQPIGLLTLEDRADGLWCKGELLMALADAQKAYLLIKAKIVKGLSIGFVSVKDSLQGGVRQLSEVKLYEGSVVTFPMNESALIMSVKATNGEASDFNDELTEIQLSDAMYQMRCALGCALSEALYSGLSKEEIISASEIIMQQFRDAYAAWLPQYIDLMAENAGGMEIWSKRNIETKAGRVISAANRAKLQTAMDTISALLAEEAVEADTSDTKAATLNGQAAPIIDHPAIAAQLKKLTEVTKWN